jgi:hypothetical protein
MILTVLPLYREDSTTVQTTTSVKLFEITHAQALMATWESLSTNSAHAP